MPGGASPCIKKGTAVARDIDPRCQVGKSHEEIKTRLANMSDEDRRYMWERQWTIEEYVRQGFGDEMDALVASFNDDGSPKTDPTLVTTDDLRVGTQPVKTPAPRPQNVDPSLNPKVEGEGAEDDYDEWTKEELVEEINARNESADRETKLPTSGNKADLVARLRADDAAE